MFVLVSESIGLLRTGNITQHCNNFISIVKTHRFWNRIHLYYWTAVRVWKGSTDVTGLLLRFLFTFKWRSQSKEERIGSGSFLRHFKSNNMSKVKIIHCVEDNRKAPIRHFHMSHNPPYLPPPPPPKRKKIGWALFSISLEKAVILRRNEKKGYAKFGGWGRGANKVPHGKRGSAELELSFISV